MEESEDKGRGFKVQDRRRFSPEGDARPGAETPERAAPPPASEPPRPQATAQSGAAPGPRPAQSHAAPEQEINFAAFIWSLSEQALAALGELPDPATGTVRLDLLMAQQMIDIIRMLRDKTRGNLDQHEDALIQEILSTLQIKYVEMARSPVR